MLLRDSKRWVGGGEGLGWREEVRVRRPLPHFLATLSPLSPHLTPPLSARPACDVCDMCPPRACVCVSWNMCDKV